MAMPLDSDLLRTFLAIADGGSVTAGADRIRRSQSAVSAQLKQLEETVGRPVFVRHGRGVTLSAAGETLIPVARQVVRSLDEALTRLRGGPLAGRLGIAIPDDRGGETVSRVIAAFIRAHPEVELDARSVSAPVLRAMLADGRLHLAVHGVAAVEDGMEVLQEEPLVWARARDSEDVVARSPLPVALFDRQCWWRDLALESLEAAGRSYRVVYSGETSSGVVSAVRAGVAVGVLPRWGLSSDLAPLGQRDGFPPLPPSYLVVERGAGADGAVIDAMLAMLRDAFAGAAG
jgi:DNA-binding transcriptional LysR family regulator